jgi:hypothetical protein
MRLSCARRAELLTSLKKNRIIFVEDGQWMPSVSNELNP